MRRHGSLHNKLHYKFSATVASFLFVFFAQSDVTFSKQRSFCYELKQAATCIKVCMAPGNKADIPAKLNHVFQTAVPIVTKTFTNKENWLNLIILDFFIELC